MTDESIFAAAITLKTDAERQAYLDEVCAGNLELRAEVEALLQAEAGAGSFLNHPPVGADATIAMSADHDTVDANHSPVSLAFLQPTDAPGRIGRIDHYEVVEVVGQGGMGMVLRAFDTKLSRIVAVKVMAPELAANPQAVKRFKREASAAAAVHHDHVVTIHAVEDQHQPPYIVMQFIEGQTLQQKIDREGALGLKQILRIGSQMAAGLAAAHKLGLIHRDVKPANILLENGVERVKITDFGLARAADDLEMTQTGMIAGTPQYMSPEQAKGETIDVRSDLFSLGSVLYTMCTGRPGFRAETTMGVLKRVCEDAPRPIQEVNTEIPAWLAVIVSKLLAKNPADRFQTAAEVAELLNQHLAHEQNPVQVARPATVALPPTPAPPPAAAPQAASAVPHPLLIVLLAVIGLPLMAAVALVGGYFFSHTSTVTRQAQGVVTLRLNDPRIEYVIDGYGPNQTAVTSVQLPFDVGPHHVWFKLGDLELDTGTFYVLEGGRHELELEISTNEAQALWDGQPLVLQLVAGNPPAGTLLAGITPVVADDGQDWIQLFNGQDLSGWKPHPESSGAWTVKDNVLVGRGTNQYLYSVRQDYQDFRLRAEVKINAAGDSGILVRMAPQEDAAWAESGYEVQLVGDPNHVSPTASIIRHGASITSENAVTRGATGRGDLIQPDQWFDVQISALGGQITVAIDGRQVVSYRDDRPRPSGHIALQSFSEATEVAFRKIEIQELSAALPRFPENSSADILTSSDWEWAEPENLGTVLNSAQNDGEPALSADGLTLVFYSNREGGEGLDDLWLSTRPSLEGSWTDPVNLGPEVNSADTDGGPTLSADGLKLVFHSDRPGGQGESDLWMSTRPDAALPWSKAVNLGADINSATEESSPALSADGLTLIFNSDRPGRYGQGDLWFSTRTSPSAPWSPARNFGPRINSPAYQGFAALASDGLSLIFNSNGAGGPWSGPFRICTRASTPAQWSQPNHLWNDRLGAWSACLAADHQSLFFDSKRVGGQGGFDLWTARRVRKPGSLPAEATQTTRVAWLDPAKDKPISAEYEGAGADGWLFTTDDWKGFRLLELLELREPKLENCRLIGRFRMKSVQAHKAYPRLIARYPGDAAKDTIGEYNIGAQGDTNWTTYEVTLNLGPDEQPEVVELGLHMEGRGLNADNNQRKNQVWIKDVELLTAPLTTAPRGNSDAPAPN